MMHIDVCRRSVKPLDIHPLHLKFSCYADLWRPLSTYFLDCREVRQSPISPRGIGTDLIIHYGIACASQRSQTIIREYPQTMGKRSLEGTVVGICDAHVHLGESGPWQPYMDPTIYLDRLMHLLDQYDVERAVVFPNPNVGDKYPEMNDYIAECVKQHPKRLVGFGRVDPRREDALKELTRIKHTLNLPGLKLHPMVECFRPDHPFFEKFFKKVNELGLMTLIHTGDGFSSPGLVLKAARKYPKLRIVLAHLREGCLDTLRSYGNIYVETSGTLPDLIELAADIDENRILFGSDVPYYRFPTQIAIVEAANISSKIKRKIFVDNFQEFVKQK